MLELGIIVYSVVIGLSLGASNNTCTIKGLVAALYFHQTFEGMGLGGCILQVCGPVPDVCSCISAEIASIHAYIFWFRFLISIK